MVHIAYWKYGSLFPSTPTISPPQPTPSMPALFQIFTAGQNT